MVDTAATARCARCGGAFHCGMHDPQPCACTTITLDAATLVDLRARYAGCLCLSCMHALSVAAATNDRTAERS